MNFISRCFRNADSNKGDFKLIFTAKFSIYWIIYTCEIGNEDEEGRCENEIWIWKKKLFISKVCWKIA